jgi:DNA-binding response OmpR family regulator
MEKPSKNQKILLLEDDSNLGLVIQENLEMRGYGVTLCTDGVTGQEQFKKEKYDLCLVDVMMPKKDGFTFVRELRADGINIPIIFLTARSLKKDRIEGLQIGADDYITKPFSMEELLLRIEAVLRRSSHVPAATEQDMIYSLGSIIFDANNQLLTFQGKKQKLTTKESELLRLLCIHKNTILPRDTALKEVWHSDNYFASRSMDVYISRLRSYLKKEQSIEIITIHGKGIKLVVAE